MENPGLVFGVVGTLVGIGGIAATVLIYAASRREKAPVWRGRARRLIGDGVREFGPLEVLYDGTPIPRLAAAEICFWNRGRATIGGNDIASTDPLRVTLEGPGDILGCEVLDVTREACVVSLGEPSENRRNFPIHFEFLDHHDGVRLLVIHTSPEADAVAVRGTLQGSREISRVEPLTVDPWWPLVLPMLAYGAVMSYMTMAFGMVTVFGSVMMGVSCLLLLSMAAWYVASAMRARSSRVPRGLDV